MPYMLYFYKKEDKMEANLTTSEKELLMMLLRKEEKTLHVEINHSNRPEFKVTLKERLQMLAVIIEKLKITEPAIVF